MTSTPGGHVHEAPAGAAGVIAECEPLVGAFVAAGRRLYLVGGIVRDLFADPSAVSDAGQLDLDLTTDARPDEVRRIIGPVVENLWTQGELFGTIAAHVGGRLVEITTHRAEAYDPGSRKPAVVFSDDVEVDLSRRDFTVNAMAIELTSDRPRVLDPFGGLADLRGRRLTTPLSAAESFSDDPLRMLRAARFVARLDMTPDPEVVGAMATMAERIGVVSPERISVELDKLLEAPDPGAGLLLLIDSGVADRFLPELARPVVAGVVAAPPDAATRLAVVLAGVGADGARRRLRAQRRSRAEIDRVVRLVQVATTVQSLGDAGSRVSDGEIRRLVAVAGDALDDGLAVAGALGFDAAAVRVAIEELSRREDLDDLGPALDGDEVMAELGIGAGRDVGRAVRFLRDLRLDEGPMDRAEVLVRLGEWWAAAGAPGGGDRPA